MMYQTRPSWNASSSVGISERGFSSSAPSPGRVLVFLGCVTNGLLELTEQGVADGLVEEHVYPAEKEAHSAGDHEDDDGEVPGLFTGRPRDLAKFADDFDGPVRPEEAEEAALLTRGLWPAAAAGAHEERLLPGPLRAGLCGLRVAPESAVHASSVPPDGAGVLDSEDRTSSTPVGPD